MFVYYENQVKICLEEHKRLASTSTLPGDNNNVTSRDDKSGKNANATIEVEGGWKVPIAYKDYLHLFSKLKAEQLPPPPPPDRPRHRV